MPSDLELFESSLSEFKTRQNALTQKLNTNQSVLDGTFRELDDTVTANSKQQVEFERLCKIFAQIQAEGSSDPNRLAALKAQLDDEKLELDAIRAVKSKTGSYFLANLLGNVNMRMWKKGEVLAFRDEYNKFKTQTAAIFILFPLVQLFVLPGVRIVEVTHQLWLLYYYSALSVRENILQVNGSDIQDWWIIHHYISMLIAVVCLLWPPGESYRLFLRQLLAFLAWQGVIMVLQNHYQKSRHYVRRSLGKAKDIDVVSSETIREKPTNLKVLVPVLYLTYLAELYCGVTAVMHAWTNATVLAVTGESWPLAVIGGLFIILGVGNALTTYWVLHLKSRKQSMMLKRRNSTLGSPSGAAEQAKTK